MSSKELTRINKYLSEIGYCSRRAADKLIEQGRVTVNGEVPEMGTKISNEDERLRMSLTLESPSSRTSWERSWRWWIESIIKSTKTTVTGRPSGALKSSGECK